jgi:predicted phage terminase large subunit-like protein
LLVLDECDFLDESVWTEALRPALADRRGGALFLSTPNREGGWFHRLVQRGQGIAAEWRTWHFPSWSNPHLDPGEIDAARATMPSLAFRREFGAEFVSAAGARVRREWIRHEDPPHGSPVAMGCDLAISEKHTADYTACVVLSQSPGGSIYVLDAQRTRASFYEVLEFVRTVARQWNPGVIAVEDVAFQRAAVQELLRTTRLNVRGVRPQGDKVSRFSPLEARYEQGLVRHAHGLARWFEEELLGFPVGEHDDGVDALTLAYGALQYARPMDVVPPPAIPEDEGRWAGFGGRGF